jgi:hypothetical protein
MGCNGAIGNGPVYVPGQSLGWSEDDCGATSDRNWVFGIKGLVFERDYEDDVYFSRNQNDFPMVSTAADNGSFTGIELSVASRGCGGNGWEARYWGLFPDEESYTLDGVGGTNTTFFAGLAELDNPTSGLTVLDVYNAGTEHTIVRDNEIHNAEVNMLRNVGRFTTRRGNAAFYEVLGGLRWFELDEEFWYITDFPAGNPDELRYFIDVANTLIGPQIGGRSEVCLGQKARFIASTKVGVFNNRARRTQYIVDDQGAFATINTGTFAGNDFNYSDSKNDLSMLGEIDLGLAYQISCNMRAVVGYRAVGVSGIALAPDQYPFTYSYEPAVRDIQSNGDLLLHGVYGGWEFAR